MRGPPPQRDPPSPPLIGGEAAYVIDDSQYDEPGPLPEMNEYSKGYFLTVRGRQFRIGRTSVVNGYNAVDFFASIISLHRQWLTVH